ncbi:MAG: hypothetical protein CVU88_03735 [Firmicutes bacterium HGW-Firmicutes-13]|nr:MAG: hypothetical protein CVU88_03735 [Firmicutes bacterium HGW-Firmicutes-13]
MNPDLNLNRKLNTSCFYFCNFKFSLLIFYFTSWKGKYTSCLPHRDLKSLVHSGRQLCQKLQFYLFLMIFNDFLYPIS